MLTQQEIEDRRRAEEIARAQQRLEGLEPDPLVVADMELHVRGDLKLSDVFERMNARNGTNMKSKLQE